MSAILRRAPYGVVYGRKRVKNARGEEVVTTDFSRPFYVRMLLQQVRSNRAEFKGQLTNNVQKLLFLPFGFAGSGTVEFETDRNGRRCVRVPELFALQAPVTLPDVGPWTEVVAPDGSTWDMAAPPDLSGSRRGVKHWVAEVKSRPPSNLEGVVDKT